MRHGVILWEDVTFLTDQSQQIHSINFFGSDNDWCLDNLSVTNFVFFCKFFTRHCFKILFYIICNRFVQMWTCLFCSIPLYFRLIPKHPNILVIIVSNDSETPYNAHIWYKEYLFNIFRIVSWMISNQPFDLVTLLTTVLPVPSHFIFPDQSLTFWI